MFTPNATLLRITFGTGFDASGQPLDWRTVADATTAFVAAVDKAAGGHTRYTAFGSSVEQPTGEGSTIVEVLVFDHPIDPARANAAVNAVIDATTVLRDSLAQGSVLFTATRSFASFI